MKQNFTNHVAMILFRRIVCLAACFSAHPASMVAQIIPDNTLPFNSVVTSNGNILTITGGTPAGTNLFHSFEQFFVLSGQAAYFNNTSSVENIVTRVTGKSSSNIDGLIRSNGTANLYLINPNGIIFGPNAQLNIGGSFIASTANSIRFEDGSEFSATNSQAPPLLTINVPIGLQFGANAPGQMQVQGANLAVETGKTLALVGGNLTISGSNQPLFTGLTAGGFPFIYVDKNLVPTTTGGRIELWSVTKGELSLVSSNGKLTIENGQGNTEFGNIQLLGGAKVDTSGIGGGEIHVQARNIQLTEDSSLSSFTLGNLSGGAITVNASDSVNIIGTGGYEDTVLRFVSGIVTSNGLKNGIFTVSLGAGSAGDIKINTPTFGLRNGAYVSASTFGGKGGDIIINSPDSVHLSAAFIATGTRIGSGDAGQLTINTGRFIATDNGILTTSSLGSGRGGDLTVNAAESLEISSGNPIQFAPNARAFGGVFTSGLGTGDAGELHINTGRLILRSGAALAASSFAQGDGGNITIKATESVELRGTSPDGQLLSAITSVTEPGSTGNGGNLKIVTGRLILSDGGRVSIRSRGTGNAGNLDLEANSILMDNQGGLEGTSESGVGGNITVRSHTLQMRRQSFISATAGNEGGAGNGGNITINTNTLLAGENSDITANAQQGTGGRVSITAKGIFGTEFRNFTTPASDITATSELGPQFNGLVQINIKDVNPSLGLVQLPENFTEPSSQITQTCSDQARTNSLRVTGRGGLPPTAREVLNSTPGWIDWRVSTSEGMGEQGSRGSRGAETAGEQGRHLGQGGISIQNPTSKIQNSLPIVEATGWEVASDRTIKLVANSRIPQSPTAQHQNCQHQ